MKIFSAEQIRNWDNYTIAHEPIASIDLMEHAAGKCFQWIREHFSAKKNFRIFCGPGNNGGDGLALSRMLHKEKISCAVFILNGKNKSADFIANLEKVIAENIPHHFITAAENFPVIEKDDIVIDALFGTGLNMPLEGLSKALVLHINQSNTIISIDMPSGLFADRSSAENIVINATHTLSFQANKLAFMLPENETYLGEIHLLDIGLNEEYYQQTASNHFIIDEKMIASIYKPRKKTAHKYDAGNALIYAGSRDMMGAAILCGKACLRTGAGLATVHTEEMMQAIIQVAVPEAITVTTDDYEKLWYKKNAVGIGPGVEASSTNSDLLQKLISHYKGSLVIDATALKLLTLFPEQLIQRQEHPAILTPHTGEFEKLFGKTANDFERMQLASHKAMTLNCFIILKGYHTLIATPEGNIFFNTTGNPGMATAGSGDVLTGMLTSLLAQGYQEEDACLLGVHLHGLAGDIAAEKYSEEAMISGDIIECIGDAYKEIKKPL